MQLQIVAKNTELNSLEKIDINSTRSSPYKNDLQPYKGLEKWKAKKLQQKDYCNSPAPFASPLRILMKGGHNVMPYIILS